MKFYEISSDKGVEDSGCFNVDGLENESPSKGPLDDELHEQSRKPIGNGIHMAYLADYSILVETM